MNDQLNHLTAPAGATQGSADYFTGVAWVKMLVGADTPADCTVGEVTFEAGARNSWHTHPHGQILVVTAGTGYYQAQGQPAQLLQPGQAVSIAPNVVHWHGATPDGRFTHLAINPSASQGTVVWLQPITEAEYQAAQG
jgi:quercetin dioxygenase-like cupin family protein